MENLIVPKDSFPLRRKAKCCNKECRSGESVLVLQYKDGSLTRNLILHARCLREVLENLPFDDDDYASLFVGIKNAVRDTGNPVPDRGTVRKYQREGVSA